MDNENLEEKCEHMMNVVVESRKRFGKMSVEYELKTSMMENKMLNLQLETISSYRFRPRMPAANMEVGEMYKDLNEFTMEIVEQHKKIEKLRRKIRSTQEVITQLKSDRVGQHLRGSLKPEALLAKARLKQMS